MLERWRERDVFAESLRLRARAPRSGSSTRARRPRTGRRAPTTCSRACSRTSTRASRRCAGYRVERKGGWDCHGLPVEIAVEQELGIKSKAEIEEYGIGEFNARCRESVFTYLEEWNRLTERIGFWLDLDDAYRTLDESYIESVWWALSQIDRARAALRGPQGRPVLPALRDDAVLARGRAGLRGRRRPERLPEAAAARAHDETAARLDDDAVDAARQRRRRGRPRTRPTRACASATSAIVLAEDRCRGGARRGRGGRRALQRLASSSSATAATTARSSRRATASPAPLPILADDFVTTEDGTGIVHLAPAFGEDDYRVAAAGRALPTATTRARCTTRSGPTAPTTSACAAATASRTTAASSRTRS